VNHLPLTAAVHVSRGALQNTGQGCISLEPALPLVRPARLAHLLDDIVTDLTASGRAQRAKT
jgi:hypothetical protein